MERFLERIASAEPEPASGSVAAVAVAMAAGLVAMAARLAHEWPKASEVVEQAEALRSRMATLALADADAYAKVTEAMRLPRDSPSRAVELEEALSGAAEVPLAVAEAAAEVAVLAKLVAAEGNERLRGDALVAAELAGAGARGAAELVAINLAGRDDPRVRRAQDLAAATSRP
ncbi:MAG: methenyltetrahydrofolate cyclohydrolase [Gaiellaceae bacterium]|nr:methenyltetrahydrofolate cyclohydrolase [Gaiellaceae bacterium]